MEHDQRKYTYRTEWSDEVLPVALIFLPGNLFWPSLLILMIRSPSSYFPLVLQNKLVE